MSFSSRIILLCSGVAAVVLAIAQVSGFPADPKAVWIIGAIVSTVAVLGD